MRNTINFILVLACVLGVIPYTTARHAKSKFDYSAINLIRDIVEDCKNGLETFEYYPYDCQKYYSCSKGAPQVNTCDNGLYWNDKVKACDVKEDVDCSNIIPFPAHIIPEPDSTSVAPQPSTDVTEPSTAVPNPSTVNPDLHCDIDLEYFADPYNCQGYYQCLNGIKQHEFCNEGLLWNVHIPGCDENSDCSQLLVSTEKTDAPTAAPTESTTSSVCQEGDRNEYIPDCHRFFECQNNRWVGPFQCPADLYWSQANKRCVVLAQSDCNKH
ncbi:probable chitinase 10 isoform X2 [Diabrotica virgifera virgifera]|uniref:Probable chitinase 10 isoform X2 n=1 Tax=Diabrotica virgifera virgifera TaxID=50390 RepID=A0A6P7G5M4_DIAVI|nr:probable chitinase 10 isoform X2 [Diabrotica virgifera virgifera]